VQIYAAFNGDGVSVLVSESDLDAAARVDAPLSTELADAAAQARRTDLIGQLRASLDGGDRAQKLAAAKALLAMDDRPRSAVNRTSRISAAGRQQTSDRHGCVQPLSNDFLSTAPPDQMKTDAVASRTARARL